MEDRVITKRLSKDRVIKFNMVPGYVQTYLIKDTILDHEIPVMNYQLAMWDDFNFNCWINCSYEEEQELKEVTFDFDLDHPLYIPFLHLLRGDKELIIDDDDTYEDKMKYMVIRNEGDVIKLSFINNLEKDDSFHRFNVFIKNIMFDLRSKIDCEDLDTKERLLRFYHEVYNLFTEEYHQITIEEYLLNKTKTLSKKNK